MVYQFKTGAMYKVEAKVAAEVMNELEAEGKLSAKELVNVSRPDDAPLHDEFEWDDEIAGEKWREQQARVMIASVTIIHEDLPQKEPIRAYFHIEQNQPNYERIETIIKQEDRTEMLIKMAKKELAAFKAKYSGIQAFQKVFNAIDELFVKGA